METEIAVPRETGLRHREYLLIERLLKRRGLRLRFPRRLERIYRERSDQNAAVLFRSSIFYLVLVYAGMGVLGVSIVGPDHLGIWPLTYSLFGILILTGWLLSYNRFFQLYYQRTTSVLAGLAVTIAIIHPALIANDVMRILIHIGTVYVMVVVYLALNLRFPMAVTAGWCGGLLGMLILILAGVSIDWQLLIPTYGGSSFIGMVLCYRDERQDRRMFLQSRLLEQEKQRIQKLAERLERLSLVDSLTGLANRRYFDQVFAREWRRSRRDNDPLTLMFVDVDFFKAYNDFYGHQQGDECLRELAQIIADHASRAGDVAARYGGEEFVLLYPNMDREAARALARKIMESVHARAMPHARSRAAPIVTVSLGVAVLDAQRDHGREDLMRRADEALYHAKQGGRDRYEMA